MLKGVEIMAHYGYSNGVKCDTVRNVTPAKGSSLTEQREKSPAQGTESVDRNVAVERCPYNRGVFPPLVSFDKEDVMSAGETPKEHIFISLFLADRFIFYEFLGEFGMVMTWKYQDRSAHTTTIPVRQDRADESSRSVGAKGPGEYVANERDNGIDGCIGRRIEQLTTAMEILMP
ncbi:uncharacterized protein BT62DRAFT_1040777 [Guyanagaster necrorhizus]|uniref:Uncharacterized protein n=1 Tax=Guyanagaster necrorhizus TaxID=856835 RepID=A0A9P8ANV7_9AGAR|nr:uncharacterized protein BT62DRAFT_1040777 [Guyanagaster necrorhizus MCA 3950]KAG7442325.1 hypothetical protein BT62DRAFT_1040777 [Guyanagaster necrorhizus MCA 3950]